MALVLTTDPIMTVSDAKALLQVADDVQAILLINSLSAKFKRYTGRVQINENQTTAIVEKIIPYGGDRIYLHAPIWTGTGYTIEAKVYVGVTLDATYTYAGGDIAYRTDDMSSEILLVGSEWPTAEMNGHVQVTYKGGWATVPGDVLQGAVLQGRVDLLRTGGEVGVTSRGRAGESTQYQTAGLVQECRDLWMPYRMLA